MIKRKAFTLAEVMASVVITSMMMVAVMAFIDSASSVWTEGQTTISGQNYLRASFEFIKNELTEAKKIIKPKDNTITAKTARTKTYEESAVEYNLKYVKVGICYNIKLIDSEFDEDSTTTTARTTLIREELGKYDYETDSITSNGKINKIILARHVEKFEVKRITPWTLQITISVKNPAIDMDDDPESNEETITLAAPLIKYEEPPPATP